MGQSLSKYDVLSEKINKLSKVMVSFVSSYAIALSAKKKNEVIKKFIERLLCDAHILFEIRNDVIENKNANKDIAFNSNLENTSNQLEKIILLYIICQNNNQGFIYEIIGNFVSKKKTLDESLSCLYSNLDENGREVLKLISSDDYSFNKLPQEYKDIVIKEHNKFMSENINPYVTKEENEKIELLKAIKLYEENIDIDLNITITNDYKQDDANYKK